MADKRQPRKLRGPWYRVQAIGTIRRPDGELTTPETFVDPWAESVLEIAPRWSAGLAGIEEFSHLVVIFYLDRAARRRTAGALRQPESRADLPAIGFFATRTPRRPNPIGLSCPRLLRREANRLIVTGIDAWDSTSILDLKGYFPRDEDRPDATVLAWLLALWAAHDTERGPTGHNH